MSCTDCASGCTQQIGACNSIVTGGDGELIQKTNVTTQIDGSVDQVHVFAAPTPAAIVLTLPPCPRIGDTILVVNCNNASTTVIGGDNDLVGGTSTVASGSSNLYTFAACCMWVPFTPPLL